MAFRGKKLLLTPGICFFDAICDKQSLDATHLKILLVVSQCVKMRHPATEVLWKNAKISAIRGLYGKDKLISVNLSKIIRDVL